MKRLLLIAITLSFGFTIYAQGIIRGTVKDEATGDPIPFAKVKLEGLNKGANTDFDGEFEIKVDAGTYVLLFSMSGEGYIDQKDTAIVNDDDVVLFEIVLSKSKAVQNLKGVDVVYVKTEGAKTVEADDKRRMEAKGATDGMTDEQIKNTGASTAVEAAQMVPGLSIEDGKSVYVRGLGDRYTKTILNGMDIPGLDPDRNSVQMDIFPATIIDNITVYKTFTPNLAGDFTGGLVDITTKDFPTQKTLYIKAGFGYNTATTFNKDYIGYEGGKLDFLGFDDGTRALPIRTTDAFPHPAVQDSKLSTLTNKFGDVMATEKSSNFLNQNYAISFGNRLNKKLKSGKNITYGYNIVLNYSNNHQFYDSVQFNAFRKEPTLNETRLVRDRSSVGQLAEHNVLWTALLGQSFKIKRSKYSLTLFRTQNGQSSASNLVQINSETNPSTLEKTSLQYTQRSVTNANLSGRHFLDSLGKWKLDWKLSPTLSSIQDPDIRSTILEILDTPGPNGEPVYALTPSVGSEIRRIWRYLTEYNLSGRLDLAYTFNVRSLKKKDTLESELSFGGLNTYKHRKFEVYDYLFNVENPNGYESDPNWYFEDENIWSLDTDQGTYGIGAKEPANTYTSRQNVLGGYVMNELPLSKKFKVTYGARVEQAKIWYTGQNNTGTVIYNDTLVLNNLNVLPSVNMAYKIEKEADSIEVKKGYKHRYKRFTNFRGAYFISVARPSFKEKSIAQIYDPIQGRRFNGNIDLKQTTIHNADIRWEYFFGRTELVSASAFYKKFIDPIELMAFETAPNDVLPINSGVANIYGAEIELRKAIGFKNKPYISFIAGANFTYVYSQIDMKQVIVGTGASQDTEYNIRVDNARDGETVNQFRPMYGQSPYIVNAFLSFKHDSLGLNLNVSYNVQGKKLAIIGIGQIPDVYENPFHGLNIKASKTLGKKRNWSVSITGKNLLSSSRSRVYHSYGSDDQIYDKFSQGTTITGSVSYLLSVKKK